MKNVLRFAILGLTMSTAAPLFAGGLWFEIGNPKAVSDPAALGAFATVRVFGYGGWILVNPVFTGTAEGVVNHRRVSMPLTFTKLAPEGLYAVRWERPNEGTWGLDIRLHEWSSPGSSIRVEDRNLSADLFAVDDDRVKPQVKLFVPRRGGLLPMDVDREVWALAGEQISSR